MMTMILAKEFEGALWILAKDHQAALEQQAVVIEQMRDALRSIRLICDQKYGWPIIDKALDLQPCPEVLNKVRAAAVREVADKMYPGRHSAVGNQLHRQASLIEKGEA